MHGIYACAALKLLGRLTRIVLCHCGKHISDKTRRRVGLFSLVAMFTLIFYSHAGQSHPSSLWYGAEDTLLQVNTENNQLGLSVWIDDLGKLQGLMAAPIGDVWSMGEKSLRKIGADGATLLELDLKAWGLEGQASGSLNPYDLSLWFASGKNLLHVDANGQLLGKVALPGVGRGIYLGLDEHLWVLGNKELWRYASQGELVTSHDLRSLIKEEPKHFVVDSVGNRIWLAGEKRLAQFDPANNGSLSINVLLPKPVQALAMDERNGMVWVLMEDLVFAFKRDGTQVAAINLGALQIERATAMVFDGFSQSLWLGYKNGLVRFSSMGELQARLASDVPIEKLGVASLVVSPQLRLIQPIADDWIGNTQPTLTLGLEAWCFDLLCDLGAQHIKSFKLEASLDGNQVGDKFQFDPDSGQTNYMPAKPLAEGGHKLKAKAVDQFGHLSNEVSTAFTIDTIPPAFLKITPPDGSVFTEPQIAVSGTVDDAEAWVLLNGSTNQANTLNGNFSFPVLLEPGINTINLSVHDKAANSSSIDLHLGYVPDVSVTVSIDSPTAGANIQGGAVLVSGTFQGPSNTGITVNGNVASQNGNRYYASVPLVPGDNALTVTATRPDGITATQSVSITSGGSSPISVIVEPASGIAPLKTSIVVQNNTVNPFGEIQADFDGNGTVDFATTDLGARIETTYAMPGVYQVKVSVTDSMSNVFAANQTIVVQDLAKLDAMLRGIYSGMLDKLRQGNIDAALTSVTSGMHDKYKAVFLALKPNLMAIVDQLGEIQDGTIGSDFAEYVIARNTATGTQAFLIYFVLSEDGVWRIDGM